MPGGDQGTRGHRVGAGPVGYQLGLILGQISSVVKMSECLTILGETYLLVSWLDWLG